LFDVTRQICDFRARVTDCDVDAAEPRPPKPLLEAAGCGAGMLGCADATCLPKDLFCDGTDDCIDSSDEGWCGQYSYKIVFYK
jgi:Low-density lipoprotein receptor domain class A